MSAIENHRESRHLWIGNIPENQSIEMLNEFFSRFGSVEKVEILPESIGDSCGICAFVDFTTLRAAKKIFHTKKLRLGGRELLKCYREVNSKSRSVYRNSMTSASSSARSNGRGRNHSTSPLYKASRSAESTSQYSPTKLPKDVNDSSSRKSSVESIKHAPHSKKGTRHLSSSSSEGRVTDSDSSGEADSSDGRVDESSEEARLPTTKVSERMTGVVVSNLPIRSSDQNLKDGLFFEFKKLGKVVTVRLDGYAEGRRAFVYFKLEEDCKKALRLANGKKFFGMPMDVEPWYGQEFGVEFLERFGEEEISVDHAKSSRTLFVGNLSRDVTESDIYRTFRKFGKIIDVEIKNNQVGETTYAFIQFPDMSTTVEAIKLNDNKQLGKYKIKTGFGKTQPTVCLWIANLAKDMDDKYLIKRLTKISEPKFIVIDQKLHEGLVYFATIDAAIKVYGKMRNVVIDGRKLRIDYSSREHQKFMFELMKTKGNMTEKQEMYFTTALSAAIGAMAKKCQEFDIDYVVKKCLPDKSPIRDARELILERRFEESGRDTKTHSRKRNKLDDTCTLRSCSSNSSSRNGSITPVASDTDYDSTTSKERIRHCVKAYGNHSVKRQRRSHKRSTASDFTEDEEGEIFQDEDLHSLQEKRSRLKKLLEEMGEEIPTKEKESPIDASKQDVRAEKINTPVHVSENEHHSPQYNSQSLQSDDTDDCNKNNLLSTEPISDTESLSMQKSDSQEFLSPDNNYSPAKIISSSPNINSDHCPESISSTKNTSSKDPVNSKRDALIKETCAVPVHSLTIVEDVDNTTNCKPSFEKAENINNSVVCTSKALKTNLPCSGGVFSTSTRNTKCLSSSTSEEVKPGHFEDISSPEHIYSESEKKVTTPKAICHDKIKHAKSYEKELPKINGEITNNTIRPKKENSSGGQKLAKKVIPFEALDVLPDPRSFTLDNYGCDVDLICLDFIIDQYSVSPIDVGSPSEELDDAAKAAISVPSTQELINVWKKRGIVKTKAKCEEKSAVDLPGNRTSELLAKFAPKSSIFDQDCERLLKRPSDILTMDELADLDASLPTVFQCVNFDGLELPNASISFPSQTTNSKSLDSFRKNLTIEIPSDSNRDPRLISRSPRSSINANSRPEDPRLKRSESASTDRPFLDITKSNTDISVRPFDTRKVPPRSLSPCPNSAPVGDNTFNFRNNSQLLKTSPTSRQLPNLSPNISLDKKTFFANSPTLPETPETKHKADSRVRSPDKKSPIFSRQFRGDKSPVNVDNPYQFKANRREMQTDGFRSTCTSQVDNEYETHDPLRSRSRKLNLEEKVAPVSNECSLKMDKKFEVDIFDREDKAKQSIQQHKIPKKKIEKEPDNDTEKELEKEIDTNLTVEPDKEIAENEVDTEDNNEFLKDEESEKEHESELEQNMGEKEIEPQQLSCANSDAEPEPNNVSSSECKSPEMSVAPQIINDSLEVSENSVNEKFYDESNKNCPIESTDQCEINSNRNTKKAVFDSGTEISTDDVTDVTKQEKRKPVKRRRRGVHNRRKSKKRKKKPEIQNNEPENDNVDWTTEEEKDAPTNENTTIVANETNQELIEESPPVNDVEKSNEDVEEPPTDEKPVVKRVLRKRRKGRRCKPIKRSYTKAMPNSVAEDPIPPKKSLPESNEELIETQEVESQKENKISPIVKEIKMEFNEPEEEPPVNLPKSRPGRKPKARKGVRRGTRSVKKVNNPITSKPVVETTIPDRIPEQKSILTENKSSDLNTTIPKSVTPDSLSKYSQATLAPTQIDSIKNEFDTMPPKQRMKEIMKAMKARQNMTPNDPLGFESPSFIDDYSPAMNRPFTPAAIEKKPPCSTTSTPDVRLHSIPEIITPKIEKPSECFNYSTSPDENEYTSCINYCIDLVIQRKSAFVSRFLKTNTIDYEMITFNVEEPPSSPKSARTDEDSSSVTFTPNASQVFTFPKTTKDSVFNYDFPSASIQSSLIESKPKVRSRRRLSSSRDSIGSAISSSTENYSTCIDSVIRRASSESESFKESLLKSTFEPLHQRLQSPSYDLMRASPARQVAPSSPCVASSPALSHADLSGKELSPGTSPNEFVAAGMTLPFEAPALPNRHITNPAQLLQLDPLNNYQHYQRQYQFENHFLRPHQPNYFPPIFSSEYLQLLQLQQQPRFTSQNFPFLDNAVEKSRDAFPNIHHKEIQKLTSVWEGPISLKNDSATVQIKFLTGNQQLAKTSLHNLNEGVGMLRIAQRMRLDRSQLEGVINLMQVDGEFSLLIAVPSFKESHNFAAQTDILERCIVKYLTEKHAAGIINISLPEPPSAVLHIFPPCSFTSSHIKKVAPDLLSHLADVPYLFIVMAIAHS